MQASTSLAHALRYVRQERADITCGKLVFRSADHRHKSASKRAATLQRYDDGLASLDAVKNLPCAGDVVRLFIGKRSNQPAREDRVVQLTTRRYDRSVAAFTLSEDGRRVYA